MNFALNYYGSVEQAQKFSIRPYRFPAFCEIFLFLPLTIVVCLWALLSLFAMQQDGIFWFFGASILLFILFRLLSILLWGTGTISIDESGFSIQGLFNRQRFISWEDFPEFSVEAAGSKSWHKFVTLKTKRLLRYQIRYLGYPISNEDLCDYLSRMYQLAIHTKPLEDYSRYQKMSNWCTFTNMICLILGLALWLGTLPTFLRTLWH